MNIASLTRAAPFGVSRADIIGPSRCKREARARAAVAWVARQKFDRSYRQIAFAIGRKDHTTALAAIRRAEALRANDDQFRAVTDALSASCEPALSVETSQ